MSPEGAVRGLPELPVHLLSSWQLCCFTNNPMNRSRSKKARDWGVGVGLGSSTAPKVQWELPMCGGGRGEGAHCPPRREVLGSVTSYAKCSPSGRWHVQTLAFPSLARQQAVPGLWRTHVGFLGPQCFSSSPTDSSWAPSSFPSSCLLSAWGFCNLQSSNA